MFKAKPLKNEYNDMIEFEKATEPYDAYLRKPKGLSEPIEFTMELESPMTKEDWEKITDVEMERTDKIVFTTPSLKEVEFVKANQKPCDMVTMTHGKGGLIRFMFSDGLTKDVRMFKMPEKAIPTNADILNLILPKNAYISVDRRGNVHIRGIDEKWLDKPFKGVDK